MPEKNISAPADGFTVSALKLKETHLLRLTLDDAMPAIADTPRYQFRATSNVLFTENQPELLRVDMQIDVSARVLASPGKASAKAKARMVVAVVFHYDGLQALRKNNALPVELGWTAVSIAYSTVRGIFQARLSGTSFDKALLPIVSPQKLWQPPAPVAQSEAFEQKE
ncbi:MAG TPA: hypothetical protein VF630_20395 [Hymenobacter sp.]|jgi:hypothetical protein